MNQSFTQGHALLIGVGGPDLPGTITDAQGLGDILRHPAYCAYPPNQVETLTAEGAARQHIRDALARLAGRTSEQDTVVVYFSGHGYRVTSSMGAAYYLLPHDYDVDRLYETAISGQELSAALLAIPHRKMLLLLDCCHAGGLDNIKAPGLTLTPAAIPLEAAEKFGEGSGRMVIASSFAHEKSFAGKPYSAFTLALIEALCGVGAAQQDGFAYVADLALHAREKVPQRTGDRQHPFFNFAKADNFAVAYYAAGDVTPKGLPFTVTPEIEAEPGALARQQGVTYISKVKGSGVSVQGEGNQVATGRSINIGGRVKKRSGKAR
ncbi:MAG: caspase family protein [Anaerolinea sp.]|nr:caspase family protein [Anaerolinea sp.]